MYGCCVLGLDHHALPCLSSVHCLAISYLNHPKAQQLMIAEAVRNSAGNFVNAQVLQVLLSGLLLGADCRPCAQCALAPGSPLACSQAVYQVHLISLLPCCMLLHLKMSIAAGSSMLKLS